jgi:hypothetical protein
VTGAPRRLARARKATEGDRQSHTIYKIGTVVTPIEAEAGFCDVAIATPSGDAVTVPGVRHANTFTPRVGRSVVLQMNGDEPFVVSEVSAPEVVDVTKWEHLKLSGYATESVESAHYLTDFSVIDHQTHQVTPLGFATAGDPAITIGEGGTYLVTLSLHNVGFESGAVEPGAVAAWLHAAISVSGTSDNDSVEQTVYAPLIDNGDGSFNAGRLGLSMAGVWSLPVGGTIQATYDLALDPLTLAYPAHSLNFRFTVDWLNPSDIAGGCGFFSILRARRAGKPGMIDTDDIDTALAMLGS